jgi:hypothetical protein
MAKTCEGVFQPVRFLVDTGADSTVFSADIFALLALPPIKSHLRAEGIGGRASSKVVETDVQLKTQIGQAITFKGQFLAFTDPAALDMSVLGRDITNHFALIVDRPQELVCLLGQGHRYAVVEG